MGPKAGSSTSISAAFGLQFGLKRQGRGKTTTKAPERISASPSIFECANPKPESGRKRVAEFGLLGRRELHFGVQEAPRPPRSCRNGKSTNFLGPLFASKNDEIIDGRARIFS